MMNKLTDKSILDTIKSNQTRKLFKKVEEIISHKEKIILQRALMMTSENIHINSFMYEPILDTSIEHLKELYKDIERMF